MAAVPPPPEIHRSVLTYRRGLYGKIALLLVAVSILLYALHAPAGGIANGGTWVGYLLGTIGLALIVWLGWFGIRRRQYGPKMFLLEEWLSAHVYLGLALVVTATLHTAFRFGWNVHTLAYGLMVVVILSGAFGLYAFRRYPAAMTKNRNGTPYKSLIEAIVALDFECRELAMSFDDETAALVYQATCTLPAFRFRDLSSRERVSPTLEAPARAAIARLRALVGKTYSADQANVMPLVQALTNRALAVARLRRDQRYRVLMQIWRVIHLPLTVGLLVALGIHVLAVFYFW
ncbi:MAG: hypothetical protein JWO51_5144 [Rhodospirillales bacterium]|nr:hypothetical protein [Rhodospirillales bacterium]